jgi:hypothetical protein
MRLVLLDLLPKRIDRPLTLRSRLLQCYYFPLLRIVNIKAIHTFESGLECGELSNKRSKFS